jgi:hypothetical protein
LFRTAQAVAIRLAVEVLERFDGPSKTCPVQRWLAAYAATFKPPTIAAPPCDSSFDAYY